jgi:hypothetical protein
MYLNLVGVNKKKKFLKNLKVELCNAQTQGKKLQNKKLLPTFKHT